MCQALNFEKELFFAGELNLARLKHSLYMYLFSFFVVNGFDVDLSEHKLDSVDQSCFYFCGEMVVCARSHRVPACTCLTLLSVPETKDLRA